MRQAAIKSLRWLLLGPPRLAALLLTVLLPATLILVAFLLYSETGTALLLERVGEATHGALRFRSVEGPLTGPLTVDGLVYEDMHVRVEVEHAELDWNPYALVFRQLSVSQLEVSEAKLVVKHTPPDPEQKDAITHLPFAIVVKQGRIGGFEIVANGVPLLFSGIGLEADWTGDTITVEQLATHYAPLGDLTLQGELRMEPRQLRIVKAQVGGYGDLQLAGEIGYHNHFSADASWKNLRWPQAGAALFNSPSGKLSAEGAWDAFAYSLSGDAESQGIAGVVDARGHGSTHGLDVERLQAKLLRGEIVADGRLAWSPQISISAQGSAEGLDPSAQWPAWPGHVGGKFSAKADWSAGKPAADFMLDLTGSKLRDIPFSLESRGRYDGGALNLAQTVLRSGASRLQAQGRATAPFDLKAEVQSPDLANLWPGLKGSGRLRGSLQGTLDQPHVVAEGRVDKLAYGDFTLERANLDADLDPRRPSRLDLQLQNLAAGLGVPEVSLHAQGTAARHEIQLKTRTQAGGVELGLHGALDLKRLEWSGQLASGHGTPDELPDWTLEEPADLRYARDNIDLEAACWRSSQGRACVQFHRQDAAMRVAFRLQDWAFAYFQSFLPPQWTVGGSASGTGLLLFGADGLREARTDLRTTAGQLKVGSQVALAFEPSSLVIQEQASGLRTQLQLPMRDGGVYLDATLAPAPALARRPLRGTLKVDFSDLTPLRILSSEIESVGGKVHGQFVLGGTAAQPRGDGSLKLSDGAIRLATPGIELKAVQAELRSSAASALILFNASATSGGGELRVDGQTDPRAEGKVLSLKITGKDFQAVNVPQAHVWMSPDLRFDLGRDRADLAGEVLVPRAEILPRTFGQGIGPSRDQVIVGPAGKSEQGGLLKVYSNVRIVLGEAVRFEGFGLKSGLQGAITAFDEPGRPTAARGEIRVVDGRYKAYGQDLNIETGRLLFNGGAITDPAIELRAVRRDTEDVTVGIYARGTLAAPQFSLFSTPDMPQDQQLSWLVLGRPMEQNATAGERSAVNDAALSLGVSGGSYLTQRLGSGLKLDEISIASKPGQTADQAQFTIGKYLSPKLFISYGIGVFQPGHSFRLLYDIGKHFKLSTESGVESGGDLIYTIEK